MMIPFDFKITKLEHSNWNRENLYILATQLIQQQGTARFHLDNRIIIAFDKSTTSSLAFIERNERIILEKLIQMLKEPEKYWYRILVGTEKLFVCVLLIKEGEYYKLSENYEHTIKDGLVEEDKAQFAHKFLQHAEWVSDGLIKPHSNPKEKGIDGWILLPTNLLEG